jgi:hypothetical protein
LFVKIANASAFGRGKCGNLTEGNSGGGGFVEKTSQNYRHIERMSRPWANFFSKKNHIANKYK